MAALLRALLILLVAILLIRLVRRVARLFAAARSGRSSRLDPGRAVRASWSEVQDEEKEGSREG